MVLEETKDSRIIIVVRTLMRRKPRRCYECSGEEWYCILREGFDFFCFVGDEVEIVFEIDGSNSFFLNISLMDSENLRKIVPRTMLHEL